MLKMYFENYKCSILLKNVTKVAKEYRGKTVADSQLYKNLHVFSKIL